MSLIRFTPGAAFTVEVRQGRVSAYAKPALPSEFLRAVQDQVDHGALRNGVFYGARQQGGLTLKFLPGFPERARQPLLNSWHIHKSRYRI